MTLSRSHWSYLSKNAVGTSAKAATGYFVGYLLGKMASGKPVVEHDTGLAGSYATDNYLPCIPDVGDVKTMIYRTNRETEEIEHFVIDTNSYNLLGWKYFWETYK
jgi:hypothetical protein